jgi:hypothetical protein
VLIGLGQGWWLAFPSAARDFPKLSNQTALVEGAWSGCRTAQNTNKGPRANAAGKGRQDTGASTLFQETQTYVMEKARR